MSSWTSVIPTLTEADRKRVIDDVAGQLENLSLAEMRGDPSALTCFSYGMLNQSQTVDE